ncbi:MAG: response regulator [Alphaproteobacteria bacterium]|nr:response regulator [Alphaproteobacteria bacterium]
MASPGFDRLSVLIVDESPIVRSIQTAMFETLGTRQIFTAPDGKAAIDFIQRVATAPDQAGTSQLDLLITDLILPRVDGFTLLNWVRNAPTAPDRFLAAIAASSVTHSSRVARARDLGVNEFVAKPFTIELLTGKILHIINQPRQFVLAPNYFGPDRRRIERPVDIEQRLMRVDRVQIVNAGDGVKEIRRGSAIIYMRLRNRLREKIGSGQDVPPLNPDILRAIAERVRQYVGGDTDWLLKQVKTLQAAVKMLAGAPDLAARHLDTIHTLAMELRGQGELFDFPLVSEFAVSLYDLTHGYRPQMSVALYLELIEAHVQGIKAIIHQHITGAGGPLGDAIRVELMRARGRFGQFCGEPVAV